MRRAIWSWSLVALVAGVAAYNVWVASHEATHPEVFALLYLALSAFVGTYSALDGQPPQPSAFMSLGLLAALLTTFSAAIGAVRRLSRSSLVRWSTARRRGGAVVIGSSQEADALARSFDAEARKALVRILENGTEEERGSAVMPNWQTIGDDAFTRRLITAASTVIVAASTDVISARLAAAIQPLLQEKRPFRLVRSPELANALRPDLLTALSDTEDFHPADNVGQLVTRIISIHSAHTMHRIRVALIACGNDPSIDAIRVWLANVAAATSFISGTPTYEVVNSEHEADLCIVAGSPVAAAVQVSRTSSVRAVIAVVPADLLGSVALAAGTQTRDVSDWFGEPSALAPGTIVVVDPERDGLDVQVVTDGVEAQWGRAFDDAYSTLYSANHRGRAPHRSTFRDKDRDEQSSKGAAIFMLENLRMHGYELKRGAIGWIDGPPSPEIVSQMARCEHDEWRLRRTWTDQQGVTRSVAVRRVSDGTWQDGLNAVQFDDLDQATQDYNRDVVVKVYVSLAAIFGYGIRTVVNRSAVPPLELT